MLNLTEKTDKHGEKNDVSAFVGTYRLLSFHAKTHDGRTVYPIGEKVIGRLIYDQEGRMAVQLMNPDRPAFHSEDPFSASDEEIRAAFHGYMAYYGSYSVQWDEQIVTHHLTAASIPNWVGSDQVRIFEFSQNQLTLTTPPISLDGTDTVSVLVWERLC